MKTGLSRLTFCLVLALLALTVYLGFALAPVIDRALEEARTTPTPLPVMPNVMAVTPDPSLPTPEPLLRTGSQGELVRQLQARLQELGYYTGVVDGQYGPGTRDAVMLFQQAHGLSADGVCGPQTRSLVFSGQAFRYSGN